MMFHGQLTQTTITIRIIFSDGAAAAAAPNHEDEVVRGSGFTDSPLCAHSDGAPPTLLLLAWVVALVDAEE